MKTAVKCVLLTVAIAVSIAGTSALVFKIKETLDERRRDQDSYAKRTINPGDL